MYLYAAEVRLAWIDNNPHGATVVFHVYRASQAKNRCPDQSRYTRIVSTVTTQYRDVNVSGGASYCYSVSAVTSEESLRSAVMAVKIPRKGFL